MKKATFNFAMMFLVLLLASCGGSSFIDDGNGHKQYKDSSGNFVKNDWAEIKGKKYFFDMNGYLVTNDWVQNQYYVGEDGIMKTNYWYKDNKGDYYYLGNDGAYLKKCIYNIDGKEYAFDDSGMWIRNRIFINPEDSIHIMYADEQGEIVKEKEFFDINGSVCNIDKNGFFVCNEWKENDGKWYYFGNNGFRCINTLINDEFAVDENGIMITNQKRVANNIIYTFGGDGKAIKKEDGNFYSIISKFDAKESSRVSKLKGFCTFGNNNTYLEYSCATSGRYYESFTYGAAPDGTYALDKHGEKHIQMINEYFGLPSDLAYKISHTKASDQTKTAENEIVIVSYKFYKPLYSEQFVTSIKYTYKNMLNVNQ